MTGESVMVQPRVSPRFFTWFASLGMVLRKLATGVRAAGHDRAIQRPFPFFGE